MPGVNRRGKLEGIGDSEMATAKLFDACAKFLKLNKIWLDANPEGESSASKSLDAEERRRLLEIRNDALRDVIKITPLTPLGLLAKYDVLTELTSLGEEEEEEDSPRSSSFCRVLVDDYHRYFLKQQIYQMAKEEKKSWRFNLQYIFGNLGG